MKRVSIDQNGDYMVYIETVDLEVGDFVSKFGAELQDLKN